MSDILRGSAQAHAIGLAHALAYLVVAAVVAALVSRRNDIVLGLLLVAVPFNVPSQIGPTTIDFPKVILATVVVVAIACGKLRELLPDDRFSRWILAAGLTGALATAATMVQAEDRGAALREALKAFELVVAFVAATYLARSLERRLPSLGTMLAVVTLLVSATAFYDEAFSRSSAVIVGGRVVPRAAGVLEGPNQLAGYLQILVPLLVAGWIRQRRPMLLVSSVAGFVALVTTLSRSGIVTGALAVAIVVAVLRIPQRGSAAGPAAIGACLVLFAAAALFIARSGPGEPAGETANGLATRSELWHAAIVLWQRNPLFGIGAGNYELSLPSVGLLMVRTHANNYYLQTLAEGGVLLLTIACATLVLVVAVLSRRARSSWPAAGMLAATIGIIAHQTVDDLFFYPKISLTWWILLGVALMVRASDAERRQGGVDVR